MNKTFAKMGKGIYYLIPMYIGIKIVNLYFYNAIICNNLRLKRKNKKKSFFLFKVCLFPFLQKSTMKLKTSGFSESSTAGD
jgi:hypothetical protein